MLLYDGIEEFRRQLAIRDKSRITIYNYTQDLKRFNDWYIARFNHPCEVEAVQEADVEEYLSYMKNFLGLVPVSRNRVLNTMKSFYKTLNRKRLVDVNPVLDIEPAKEQRKERTYLTMEEFERLLTGIKSPLIRLFVTTLFLTGMRVSEATGLTVANVDLQNRVIHVIAGKGNKNRDIPVGESLHPMLCDYYEQNRKDAEPWQRFFATERTGMLTAGYVTNTLKKATERAGITKNVTPHVLRHSFASALVKNGVSIVHLQKLLGHSNLSTTSVYTHVSKDDLVNAVNTLAK